MYSGWSPLLRVKFWKKELVGRGDERRCAEMKSDGSGRTVDSADGNRNGAALMVVAGGGDMDSGAGAGGGGVNGGRGGWGFWGFLNGFVMSLVSFLSGFLMSMIRSK